MKLFTETKVLGSQKESERQLHEVITMIEDIAKLSKSVEQ